MEMWEWVILVEQTELLHEEYIAMLKLLISLFQQIQF